MTLPKKTLAAILVEQKKDLVVTEIELPSALEIGQVFVEFLYSGICGSQLGEIDGIKGPDKWLPHLLGHEATGLVLSVGPGVKHVRPGQHVVAHWRPGQGIESATPKYLWNGTTVNAGWVTTFNRHAVISENRLTALNSGTDLKTAALYGCAITTGLGTIENKAKIRFGEKVVIFGSGGIGLNLIQGAYLAGASEIIAIDRYDGRLDLAQKMGATVVINSSNKDPFNEITKLTDNKGVDVFIDNTGNTDVISRGYKHINSDGRVILVGVPSSEANTNIHTLDLHFGKIITGTSGGESLPHRDIPRYISLFERRKIQLGELITEVGALKDINHFLSRVRSGETSGRCMIDLNL